MLKRKSEGMSAEEGIQEKAFSAFVGMPAFCRQKNYLDPKTVSMEEFTLKTAVGVSPAMKKKDNYIVSTLF